MQEDSSEYISSAMQSDLSDFAARLSQPLVYVDHREEPGIIEMIKARGCTVKIIQLEIGDYVVSDRTVVERKRRDDFETSIIDGRLFEQAIRLSQTYEKVIYVIEGHSFAERVNRKALMAAVSSIILNYNASVFFTKDFEGTSELVSSLAFKEQIESKRTVLIKKPQKHDDPNINVLYVASALPMIGEKTAEKLLLHFGSLQNLFNATEQDLVSVNGIGKQRAREIAKFIRMKFQAID